MTKIKLSQWANIAEIMTSIVVVVSLAYVAYEINQNTKSLQQETYRSVLDRLTNQDLLIAANKDLHRIVKQGELDPAQLSEEEWSRFEHFAFPIMGEWEFMYFAGSTDSISEVQWTAFNPYFTQLYCKPGYQKFWGNNKHAFALEFHAYLADVYQNNCVAKAKTASESAT